MDNNKPDSGSVQWAGLALIMALGAGLRLWLIGKESLWFDEGWSIWFAQRPMAELWSQVPQYETHPPLYYTLLKAWIYVLGDSESAVRGLSALAGVMTIPLVYLLGRISAGRQLGAAAGLAAGALFAMAPVQIVYAQEARPYALLILASTMAMCGAIWLAVNPALASLPYFGIKDSGGAQARRGAMLAWTALILGTAFGMWLHNMGILLAVSLALGVLPMMLIGRQGGRWIMINAVMAGAIILLLWSPFLPWFIAQSGNVKGSFWLALGPDWISNGLEHIFLFLLPGWPAKALALAMALAGIYALAQRRGVPTALAMAALITIPPAIAIAFSLAIKPMFLSRTLLWVSVPFYALMGAGLALAPGWRWKAALGILLAGSMAYGDAVYYQSYKKEPWREMVGRIMDQAHDGDAALLLPNGTQALFDYYSRRDAEPTLTIIALPQPFPALGLDRRYPTGNMAQPALDEKDSPMLKTLSCQSKDIWVVMRLPRLFDPENRLVGALSEKCRLAGAESSSVVHLLHFTNKGEP